MKGDVREVLQYVPLFSGKTFVVVFDEGLLPESAVAETLLDLIALQRIGVRLVVVVVGGEIEALRDWAIEMEFKGELVVESLGVDGVAKSCEALLKRGQAALVDGSGQGVLSEGVVALAESLQVAKLMVLLNEALPSPVQPSVSASLVKESSDAILRQAALACERGIPRVHLLDGHFQGVLTAEIFSNEGVGTMVHTDAYLEIRKLSEEDIPELLAMMGRSMRAAHLVPRNYDEVMARAEDFYLIQLDDNVVGSVALHRYEGSQWAEIACLYVKLDHEGHGYGQRLIAVAEEEARKAQVQGVFALTNRASKLFEKLDYQRGGGNDLPPVRAEQLLASGRDSEVWVKELSSASTVSLSL